jgi:hypothetical protein
MDDTTFPRPPHAASGPDDHGLRKLDDLATKLFATLVAGLTVGDAKKLDNAHGTFMAVSIDFLMGASAGRSWGLYAIAHRYLANGDLIPDPDVEFYIVDQPGRASVMAVYPLAIDHGPLGYHRYAAVDSTGEPTLLNRRGQGDLARFCDVWMRNIASQQGLEVG